MHANNKGTDQPARPRSLISAFIVRYLDAQFVVLATYKVSRSQTVYVAEQNDVKIAWSQATKASFLMVPLKNFLGIRRTLHDWKNNNSAHKIYGYKLR